MRSGPDTSGTPRRNDEGGLPRADSARSVPGPERVVLGGIDRDGVLTFVLALAVLAAGLGVPYLVALGYVFAVGLAVTPQPPSSAIWVVPGKRLRAGMPDRDFRARLATAARLATHAAGNKIILLGGATGRAALAEADAGERWLRRHVNPAVPVDLERDSRDTLTNLRHVRAMLQCDAAAAPVVLVSNRYHLARLGLMARGMGLAPLLIAAEPRRESLRAESVGCWLREGFYVVWFNTGKAWARLTANRRMLDRVT